MSWHPSGKFLAFRENPPQTGWTDRGALTRNFDLHPDGQRFVVLKAPEAQTQTKLDKVVFIFNFFDELRRIAPLRR